MSPRLDAVLRDTVTAAQANALVPLYKLPAAVRRRLAGAPIQIDGNTLDPDVQLLVRIENLLPRTTKTDVATARSRFRNICKLIPGTPPELQRVTELTVRGAAGQLGARLYVPRDAHGVGVRRGSHGGDVRRGSDGVGVGWGSDGAGVGRGSEGADVGRSSYGVVGRSSQGADARRDSQGTEVGRGSDGMGVSRGSDEAGAGRGSHGMDRDSEGAGVGRSSYGVDVGRGSDGVSVRRGSDGVGDERGSEGAGVERSSEGADVERSSEGADVRRGSQGVGRGLLVFFHGGGWVLGDLDTHDALCRSIAADAGIRVLSVDYRRPPEAPAPTAAEDAIAAFTWAVDHAEDLGVDPALVAVGGDSAGGNLAAVVAQQTVRRDLPRPALQVLLYPSLDLVARRPSRDLFSEGFILTEEDIIWYRDHYTPDPTLRPDPIVSPLRAEDLTGLPPTYLTTAGFDPLRDEGLEYAKALTQAGNHLTHAHHPTLPHGHTNLRTVPGTVQKAHTHLTNHLHAVLH